MGRPALLSDDDMLARLSRVFRQAGYAGASLTMLSQATGLKRPSLYHRFPGGKGQMAREVLETACAHLETQVLQPLRSDEPADARIKAMVDNLRAFYANGTQACLLSMLASPLADTDHLTETIERAFEAWIGALRATLVDAGWSQSEAHAKAVTAVALVQGSLVVSRGMNDPNAFDLALDQLMRDLRNDIALH